MNGGGAATQAAQAAAMNQLRQAGLQPRHIRQLARRFGLAGFDMKRVDATQVEAKLAGAIGKVDDAPESSSGLRAALRDTRRFFRQLDRKLAA